MADLQQLVMTVWRLLQPAALSFLVVAGVAGLVLLLLSWPRCAELQAQTAMGYWPPQRHRAVPWTFGDALLLLFASLGLEMLLVFGVGAPVGAALATQPKLNAVRFAAEYVALAAPVGPFQPPVPRYLPGELADWLIPAWRLEQLSIQRWKMIASVLSRLLCVVFFIAYLRARTGAGPVQLLLSAHQWLLNLLRGYALFLVVTLPLIIVFLLLQYLKQFVGEPTPHTVDKFLRLQPPWPDQLLVLVMTVVLAPVVEELLFRGIVQPLFIDEPLLADGFILFALIMAISYGLSGPLNPDWAWGPLVFLLLVGPGYLAFERLTRWLLPYPGAARGIFATALFFAVVHHSAWPTPVPIFGLGLALGFLAYRTQSLWGCMLAHALFNAVSMLQPYVVR